MNPYFTAITLVLAIILITLIILYFRYSNNSKESDADIKSHTNKPNIVKHTHGDYEVLEIFNLLTEAQCKELITYAKSKGMAESDVLSYGASKGTEVNDNFRKSKTAWLQDSEHPLVMHLALFSEQISNIPRENQEMLQVAHYETNGKFNEHFDACVYDDKAYCDKMNNYAGQRRATLLIYLNSDFQGGETEFTEIGLKIKPEAGKAILFWNTDDEENILPKSKHRANPVQNGEKWICTKWSHFKPYGAV